MIRFFYNGFKIDDDKKLYKVYFTPCTNGTIRVTSEDYIAFPKATRDQFVVVNNTNIMIDYFENEYFEISTTHELFKFAKIALLQNSLKYFTSQYKKCLKYSWEKKGEFVQAKINEYQEQIKALENA
jgi:hypothetical protein